MLRGNLATLQLPKRRMVQGGCQSLLSNNRRLDWIGGKISSPTELSRTGTGCLGKHPGGITIPEGI